MHSPVTPLRFGWRLACKTMQYTASTLEQFVATSDSFGGPGSPACEKFWADFSYSATYRVNQKLDPFSEAYVAEQIKLHEEISGRTYDVHQHEETVFDVERHIAATNPYDHPDPRALAIHVQRLSRALRYAKPRRGEVLLDMGCGWGLSSELAAYLGLTVIGVDVNPSFVRLVNERAKRLGHAISAVASTFEDFNAVQPFDIALVYECLHHSVRPWVVICRLAEDLQIGGRLVLAGEPVNDIWWKHWGLRLDALSVYCVRNFGWFESGWSIRFIEEVLYRSGLIPKSHLDNDPEIGYTIVAEKTVTGRKEANSVLRSRKPSDAALQNNRMYFRRRLAYFDRQWQLDAVFSGGYNQGCAQH
jgi:2-polyprenyl-3-methyl-5-hydroxy-6-metoxy-1,4-benzoquinol methylase